MRVPALGAVLLASCGGLSHTLHPDVPRPHRLAVLPVQGAAPFVERELARSLLRARLQERGYLVAELEFTDRVLSERSWLSDPETFSPASLPLSEVATAIGVDGVLVVDQFDETRWNALLVRRHALGARFRIVEKDGGEWWQANYTVGVTGGFLLKSGQLLTELLSQSTHGAGAASLDRIDELVEGVAEVLPVDEDRAEHHMPPGIAAPVVAAPVVHAISEGLARVEVRVEAPPGSSVWLDLGDRLRSMPMSGANAAYTGAVDVPADWPPLAVRVRVRGAFGQQAEATR
jgi:hypothetical protein